jgi:hypothetical protein
MELTKHFKLVGIVVVAFIAIIMIYGWNNAKNTKNVSPPQQQRAVAAGGAHPNLPSQQQKKPCNVCEAKRKQQQMQQGLRQNNWT